MFTKHTSIGAFKHLAGISDGMWGGASPERRYAGGNRQLSFGLSRLTLRLFLTDTECWGDSWENLQEAMFI